MSARGFDVYVPGHSWLHRLDPRVKLALVAAGAAVLFVWLSLPLLLAAITALHVVLLAARYPWSRIAAAWKAVALLLLLIVLIWPIFDRSGRLLVALGPLELHAEGLLRGIANAARLAALNLLVVLWVGTTGARELVRGFVRLGLPHHWGMALTIGLRFIPTFTAIWLTVSDAQQARGLVLAGWWLRRVRQMLPIFVAALVTALRASEQLGMTLEARGFGAGKRTVLRDIRMRPADWLALAATLLTAAAVVWLALARGVGRALLGL